MANVIDLQTAKVNHAMVAIVDTFQEHIHSDHPLYQIYQLLTMDLKDGEDVHEPFYRQYLSGIADESEPLTVFQKQYAVSFHLLMLARATRRRKLLVGNP